MLAFLQGWSWRGLRLLGAVQHRLQRRFTPAGRVVLAGTFAAALFGVDTRQTLAFQAFSLGAALVLVAWLASLRPPGPCRAERRIPRHATVGEACRYPVRVENLGPRGLAGLSLVEDLPNPRPDRATFLATRAPGEGSANPVDRLFGYPRWSWLAREGQWAEVPEERALSRLGPFSAQDLVLELIPLRRGYLRLAGLRLTRTDPLGLCRAVAQPARAQRLLVLPRRYPVAPLSAPGRRRLQPRGVSLASSVGDSQEYMGLRDYRPGDSPRHIHWAAWARTGEPVVKEYQDEYFARQALVLDSYAPPGQGAEFEAAVSVAASLVEPMQGPDSLLDLMFVGERAYTFTGGRGLATSRGLLEILACVQPARGGDFAILTRAVLQHAPRLSACLCVLLEWDEPRRELVARLQALELPVRVLLVGGRGESDPGPMADRPRDLLRLDPARLAEGLAGLS